MLASASVDNAPPIETHCLLQAVEVWKVSETDGTKLCWHSGVYPGSEDAEQVRSVLTFGPGDGLPGQVWTKGFPVIFTDLADSDFPETQEVAEIECVCGIPVFADMDPSAVLMLFFGSWPDAAVALESWRVDVVRRELGLDSGNYRNLPLFEKTSRQMKWPFGAGLPGATWRHCMPQLVGGLAKSDQFIRGADAQGAGLETALSIPVMTTPQDFRGVLLMLSTVRHPLAKAILIWQVDVAGNLLSVVRVSSEILTEQERERINDATVKPGEGLAGQAWETRLPVVGRIEDECSEMGDAFKSHPVEFSASLPVMVSQQVLAVVTFLF